MILDEEKEKEKQQIKILQESIIDLKRKYAFYERVRQYEIEKEQLAQLKLKKMEVSYSNCLLCHRIIYQTMLINF